LEEKDERRDNGPDDGQEKQIEEKARGPTGKGPFIALNLKLVVGTDLTLTEEGQDELCQESRPNVGSSPSLKQIHKIMNME
jgi:hypothetical protein